MSTKKPSKYLKPAQSKGADNEHELLKHADIDDAAGIIKYSIDLDDDMEKLTTKISTQVPERN
jgi:hypothetical protein